MKISRGATVTILRHAFPIFLFLILFTGFIFRKTIVNGLIPFPSNLHVWFYQPWASYPVAGYPNGPPTKPIGFDNLRMFYPLRTLVTSAERGGRVPLWNPFSFSGNPILGAYQSAVFFPLGFLFLLRSQISAWSLIIMLAPVFSGLGMYLFMYELTGDRKASFFGMVTFAYSGMMIVWWQEMFMSVYSMLPLPYALYAVTRLAKRITTGGFLLLVAAYVFSIFSGYFQTTFYMTVMVFLWTAYVGRGLKKRLPYFSSVCLAILTAAAVASVQLLPALEAYRNSSRGIADTGKMFADYFAPPGHIATILAPDYFGNPASYNYFGKTFYHEKVIWFGIPALILLLYGLFSWKRMKPILKFFTVTGLVFLSLGFDLPTSWFVLYTLRLPFVREMTPSRIFYLSSFCFAVASSLSFVSYLDKPDRKAMVKSLAVLLIAYTVLAIHALRHYPGIMNHGVISLRNLAVPFAVTAGAGIFLLMPFIIRRIDRTKFVFLPVLFITLFHILFFAGKYLYFNDPTLLFPANPLLTEISKRQGIDRFWSFGKGYIMTNFSNQYGLYSPEGYESFNIRRYNELLSVTHTGGKLTPDLQRADATIRPSEDLPDLIKRPNTLRLLSLLGVRYVAALDSDRKSGNPASVNLSRIWTDGTYDLYENSAALPRFFLTTGYIIETDPSTIIGKIYDPQFDLRQTLVLEEDPGFGNEISGKDRNGKADLVSYAPERVEIRTDASTASLLFLSDSYYPGWNAYVDGQPEKVYRADYAFRSVPVPPGRHKVVFAYEPGSFRAGLYVSLFSLLSVALGLSYFKFRQRL